MSFHFYDGMSSSIIASDADIGSGRTRPFAMPVFWITKAEEAENAADAKSFYRNAPARDGF